ncbi:MAG: hypothetical protein ABIP49_03365 [Lysobacterales bacterium]
MNARQPNPTQACKRFARHRVGFIADRVLALVMIEASATHRIDACLCHTSPHSVRLLSAHRVHSDRLPHGPFPLPFLRLQVPRF